MSDDETQLASPPPKRRKISVAAAGSTIQNPFWFLDGDFILRVENINFKIHRSRLQCSVIFCDCLALPQPANGDCIDGCPFVELTDSANDWLVTLKWIYDQDRFGQQCITFDILSGALRISTKYEIPDLRSWCVQQLYSRWPRRVEDMDLNSIPHAAEAIALARECDVLDILPSAFYALSIQKWRDLSDGGRSHIVLNPSDLRRLIAGRESLQDILVQIIANPLRCHLSGGSRIVCDSCRPLIERHWRTKLISNAASPLGCWLLRELWQMLSSLNVPDSYASWCADCVFQYESLMLSSVGMPDSYAGWCADCVIQHEILLWRRWKDLINDIPRFFLLE